MATTTHNKVYRSGKLVYLYNAKIMTKHGARFMPGERVIADWDNGTPAMKMILQVITPGEVVPEEKLKARTTCPRCGSVMKDSSSLHVRVCPKKAQTARGFEA